MKCVICKNGETKVGLATLTLERNGTTVVFKKVPANVCTTCGEEYVDEKITAKLLKESRRCSEHRDPGGNSRIHAGIDNLFTKLNRVCNGQLSHIRFLPNSQCGCRNDNPQYKPAVPSCY